MPNMHWDAYWREGKQLETWRRPAPEVLELIAGESPSVHPRVLDLGCGLGRHAIAFALAGYQVSAIDVSPTAIAYLQSWAAELGLAIQTQRRDALDDFAAAGTFDIVVSYNVIYHGYRRDLAEAIRRAYNLLRPGGIFFFTCPTRRDGKYGFGEEVAPHNYLCTLSTTPGDIHYFADEADLDAMLAGFHPVERQVDEGYWDNRGTAQFYSNWLITARKPRDGADGAD
jgi:tellurite methyltransferase